MFKKAGFLIFLEIQIEVLMDDDRMSRMCFKRNQWAGEVGGEVELILAGAGPREVILPTFVYV